MHYQDFDKSLPLNCYSVAFWPEFILASGEMTVCSDILLCSNRVLPSDLKIFHYLFFIIMKMISLKGLIHFMSIDEREEHLSKYVFLHGRTI